MMASLFGDRAACPAALLFAWFFLSGLGHSRPVTAQTAQTAQEAYAGRDALVQAGLEANRKTLEAVVEYAVALEGVWNDKLAGWVAPPPTAGSIPAKADVMRQAVRTGLDDLRRTIDHAARLQSEASATRDGKLALLLATDAASWTNRALHAAQELRRPLERHVPRLDAPTGVSSAPGAQRPTTGPAAGDAPPSTTPSVAALQRHLTQLRGRTEAALPASAPAGTSPPGQPPRNIEELNRYLDELSGRLPAGSAAPAAAPRADGSPPRNMVELFRYLDQLRGGPATPPLWDPPPAPAVTGMAGSRFATNLTGLFQHVDELSGRQSLRADLDFLQRNAAGEFGQGRAGAGGIALFRAAEVLSPLALDSVRGVVWKDERLILRLSDREIAFPPLDAEYLALAFRCVYGGEATYSGRLVADEANAIVIQTGGERFGEVVWRKSYLAKPWAPTTIGSTVAVELGPGLGLLAELAPSTDRVTYYGPLQNTRMGKTLFESDQVIQRLYFGVDPVTGQPSRSGVDGFQTFFERSMRKLLEPSAVSAPPPKTPPKTPPAPPPSGSAVPGPWWIGPVWMVWVPDRFSLKLAVDGQRLEFVDARMRLDTWTVGGGTVSDEHARFGEEVTARYSEFAERYPTLKELREIAKAVSVVRWLKQHQIAIDNPNWAKELSIPAVATPATVRRFAVEPVFRLEKDRQIPVMEQGTVP